jgi:hypothetical protein
MHKIIDHLRFLDQWINHQTIPVQILVFSSVVLITTALMKPLVPYIQEWRAPPVIEIQYDGNPDHLT